MSITDDRNRVTDDKICLTVDRNPITDDRTCLTVDKTRFTDNSNRITDDTHKKSKEPKSDSLLFYFILITTRLNPIL